MKKVYKNTNEIFNGKVEKEEKKSNFFGFKKFSESISSGFQTIGRQTKSLASNTSKFLKKNLTLSENDKMKSEIKEKKNKYELYFKSD